MIEEDDTDDEGEPDLVIGGEDLPGDDEESEDSELGNEMGAED